MEKQLISVVFYLMLLLASTVFASVFTGPLSPKAYLMQYWDNKIPTSPVSQFLLSRASPLTGLESAFFAGLASQNALSQHLDLFCESANLFCMKDAEIPKILEKDGGVDHRIQLCKPIIADLVSYRIAYKVGTEHRCVPPGLFFREKMLKTGTIMPIPDIRDKMPQRAFLPRTIVAQFPFSSSKVQELKHIFLISDKSTLEGYIKSTLSLCEQETIVGETKQCVASAEDMIDFAVSMLGRSIKVRTTANTNGSGKNVILGKIRAIDGGKVTKSVSCHQTLYPYLVYLCHALPNVRVYEADILDIDTKAKINRGAAICHLDTSSWSPDHAAFSLLGSAPGKIEVCHWFYQNGLAWTIDD